MVFEQNLQVDALNLAEIGPKFEHHVMFPARTNTGKLISYALHDLAPGIHSSE